MSELIVSLSTNSEFPKYVNRIIYDFKPKESDILSRPYEPRECSLIFMVRNFSFNYALEFENKGFFLKVNFEIEDDKFPDLRNRIFEKLGFLFTNEKFHCQDENSIILRSKIDDQVIERANIIFAMESWMRSYFFPETKIALEEMVSIVFSEFKETMHQVWKTIFENFETVDFSKLPLLSKEYSLDTEESNCYDLPPIIKIYFDSYHQQKLKQRNSEPIIPKKKKNWIKRWYISMKNLNH